jgi:purine-binding chemotaxis protein CheW
LRLFGFHQDRRDEVEGNDKTGTADSQQLQFSEQPGGHELLQLVGFRVGPEEFGLEILRVQEIIRIQPLTRVPNSAGFVDGVINLRGKVIPVIALRRCFALENHPHDQQTRIVVVEVKGSALGFIVDSVSEVVRIPMGAIEPPPRLGKVEREYVSGVGKIGDRLLILLNLDRLICDTESVAIQAAAN